MKVYERIAQAISAIRSCQQHGNVEWQAVHEDELISLVENYLPSGSGIDSGCSVDLTASTPDKIVIVFDYHHMNDRGFYTRWSEHKAVVTPSLRNEIDIKIIGGDRDFKDYIFDVFFFALLEETN